MKITSLKGTICALLLLCVHAVLGQSTYQNPAVSSAISFEEYPTDLYTGAPQVSIPLYSMPTRDKNVSIDLSLSYHPASISSFNKASGNVGRGWNLSGGGVISRNIGYQPDELVWSGTTAGATDDDIYSFSCMGLSGKFKISQSNKTFGATVTENPGSIVKVEVVNDPGSFNITGFKIYDSKGYVYTFGTADSMVFVDASRMHGYRFNASYQLVSITDNNNIVLATYTYSPFSYPSYWSGINNYYQILTEISVPGYGKITYDGHPWADLDNWYTYYHVIVYDYLNKPIRKLSFTYGSSFTNSMLLTQVDLGDFADTNKQSYKLAYKSNFSLSANVDTWGYLNDSSEWCPTTNTASKIANKDTSTYGVLEKMTLPTGGCIIYNYEANTYSYKFGKRMDLVRGSDTDIDPNFYSDITKPENKYNYTASLMTEGSIFPRSFSLAQSAIVYVQFDADLYTSPIGGLDGQPSQVYPQLIFKQGSSPIGSFFPVNSGQNNCLGPSLSLGKGSYTISIAPTTASGYASVTAKVLNSTINKWWYGGGIRIKTIGFFADANVSQDYYHPSTLYLPGEGPLIVPSREINYAYNLISDPTLSSGSLTLDDGGNDVVRYKNITVINSINIPESPANLTANGRTEFTYNSPIDFALVGSIFDYRTGKLANTKIYNSANFLQKEIQYTYTNTSSVDQTFEGHELEQGIASNYNMGWSMVSQIKNIDYFPTATTTINSASSTENFEYNGLHQLTKKTKTTSRSAENLITNLYYNTDYNLRNRIDEIDHTEEYLSTDLLSTTKVVYGNTWFNPSHLAIVNTSYLPSQIQAVKGTGTLEDITKINLYDRYSHILETEQPNGRQKAYVWGYDFTQIIAEIDNIAYRDIPQNLITELQTATNADTDTSIPANAAILQSKLNNLRNAAELANSFITTYTYQPLVGILSVTDARGNTTTYEYDTNNKVKYVKDQNGNILTENQYHTKP